MFDLVHFSPLSFGHIELMRRDNVPHPNRLSELLGHAPARIGYTTRSLLCCTPGTAQIIAGELAEPPAVRLRQI
ncbi:MAG: hypothetical protein E6H61_07390 [Betaproteobacteria bacterium]|nr:MAG: hypothetical protein E6H61_07390 [Betaproteobacteria bacterium]